MKIRVLRKDGAIEVISLVGASVHHGEQMDHIHSADGLDHYFWHDGTYDGWGKSAEGMTTADVADDIDRIERERVVEGGHDADS